MGRRKPPTAATLTAATAATLTAATAATLTEARAAKFRRSSAIYAVVLAVLVLFVAVVYRRAFQLPEPPDTIAAFSAWLSAGGARWPKLTIAPSDLGGFGAFATEPIAPGELTITLPRRLMLTAAEAPYSLVGHDTITEVGQRLPELSSMLPLAITLLIEADAGVRSAYAPYLATLPADVESATGYGVELRRELIGTSVEPLLRRHDEVEATAISAIAAACADERPPRPPGFCDRVFAPPRVRWALAMVRSRAILKDLGSDGIASPPGITTQSPPPPPPPSIPHPIALVASPSGTPRGGRARLTLALAPLVDILNHECLPVDSSHAGSERWVGTRHVYEVRSSRAFARGEEVRWEYGPKANHALMMSYGFSLPLGENPHDTVVINMRAARPASHDALHDTRQTLLDAVSDHFGDAPLGAPPRLVFTSPFLTRHLLPTPRVAAFVPPATRVRARILVARDASELEREALLDNQPLASDEREAEALTLLSTLVQRKLALFPGNAADDAASLEADEHVASGERLERKRRMALRLRLGEVRLLEGAKAAMDARAEALMDGDGSDDNDEED